MKTAFFDGYIVGEVKTKATATGRILVSFSINSADRRKNPESGAWESKPAFFPCTYWAKNDQDYRLSKLVKGAHIAIQATPTFEEWEGQNGKRSRVSFTVRDVYFIESRDSTPQVAPQTPQNASVYDDDIPF